MECPSQTRVKRKVEWPNRKRQMYIKMSRAVEVVWAHNYTLFFFIRTSNFDAEAERSYIFWRFEAETFLKMFLNLPGIVFQPIAGS